eukprot:COSAG02_NODE_962_length_15608_cov_16.347692_12_plen_218_part_00
MWRPGDEEDVSPTEQEPEPEPEPMRSYREGVHGSVGSGIGMSDDLARRLENLDGVIAAREWEVYDRDLDFQPKQQQHEEAAEAAGNARQARRDRLGGRSASGGGEGVYDIDGSFTAADIMDTSPISSPSSIPSPPGVGLPSGGASAVGGLGTKFSAAASVTPRGAGQFVDPSLIPAAAGAGMDGGSGGAPSTPPHVAVGRLRPKHVAQMAASPLAAE